MRNSFRGLTALIASHIVRFYVQAKKKERKGQGGTYFKLRAETGEKLATYFLASFSIVVRLWFAKSAMFITHNFHSCVNPIGRK